MRPRHFTAAFFALAALASCALAQVNGAAPGARVRSVELASVADLVVLDGGFNAGLRQGMICRVARNGVEIADLLLVELRPAHSTAILLSVSPRQSVRPGDVAHVKTLKL